MKCIMKKLFLLLLLCVLPVFSQNWTKLSPYPGSQQISCLYFYNTNLGFGVTSNGYVIRTSDGGSNWTEVYCGYPDVIQGVYFTSESVGYACGYNLWILKTSDGGLTWQTLERTPGSLKGYQSMVFTDANTGYIVGYDGVIKKTINAGVSWTSQTSGLTGTIETILHLGGSTLIAIGDAQNVARTTNGGSNWTLINSGTFYSKQDAHSSDNTNIFAVCAGGYIAKSTNAGVSWTAAASVITTQNIHAVHFTSASVGYIADATGDTWKTTDGGSSWTNITPVNKFFTLGIAFTSSTKGFFGGYQGKLNTTTDAGATWTNLNRGVSKEIYSSYFLNENTGFIERVAQ